MVEKMSYTFQHQILAQYFSTQQASIRIDDLSTQIINCRFDSCFPALVAPERQQKWSSFDAELMEAKLQVNDSFTYPIIFSGEKVKNDEAILLLHGLNERSWSKYLVWAKYLSEQTGQPVILFPLAFHMNRSPGTWNDPRVMSVVAAQRKSSFNDLKDSSYLNAALSVRLENYPEQFILSGMQSYLDVVQFALTLKEGRHPLFARNTRLNIFSYSIGAFLSELLIMRNPLKLFDQTKLCLFCGGATFDRMNGSSRFIMDNRAFRRLNGLATSGNFRRLRAYLRPLCLPELKSIWKTLWYMTFLKEGQQERNEVLNKVGSRIFAIGLARDRVFPPEDILATLKNPQKDLPTRVEIIDFPYSYTHEIPFPIGNERIYDQVDASFRLVFDKVAGFLR